GKRTGTKKARSKPREQWINRVRALRMSLREMKKEGTIKGNYRQYYSQIKGNNFRGRKHLEQVVKGESK
ncbi:MAG: 50S ribosomal protein L19e, partial [archaeon]